MYFTIETLTHYLQEMHPQTADSIVIEALIPGEVVVRMSVHNNHLRTDDTVSGPTIFTVADCAFYCALLAMTGPIARAVTSNTSINFMRNPSPVNLIGHARILKLDETLAMGDCTVYSQGETEPVAQAILTYSISSTVSSTPPNTTTSDASPLS